MKNQKKLSYFKLILSVFILLFFTACKKELTEPETLAKIKTSIKQKTITKDNFNEDIYPYIQDLYSRDTVKYKMLNHIAKKAAKEKNTEVFKMNVSNLKDELKYY